MLKLNPQYDSTRMVGRSRRKITNHHPDPPGNKRGQGQAGSAQREPQENYTTGTKVDQADTSNPKSQGAVLQLPAQEGSMSQQESLMVSMHRWSSRGHGVSWCSFLLSLGLLDILTGNLCLIWILLVVMLVFK